MNQILKSFTNGVQKLPFFSKIFEKTYETLAIGHYNENIEDIIVCVDLSFSDFEPRRYICTFLGSFTKLSSEAIVPFYGGSKSHLFAY